MFSNRSGFGSGQKYVYMLQAEVMAYARVIDQVSGTNRSVYKRKCSR